MSSKEHDSAVQRLHAALREQNRVSDRYNAATGTSNELSAYVKLRAAGEEVTARGHWLEWLDWLDTNEHSVAPGRDQAPVGDLTER
jgi:hypothetical protein